MLTVLFAGFLLAHGLIHGSYLTPAPAPAAGGPAWPFHLDRSWLLRRAGVGAEGMVATGRALAALTMATFALAAAGVLVGAAWWVPVAVVAASVSLVQLVVWFHWWLPVGVVIDVLLIAGLAGGWGLFDRFLP